MSDYALKRFLLVLFIILVMLGIVILWAEHVRVH